VGEEPAATTEGGEEVAGCDFILLRLTLEQTVSATRRPKIALTTTRTTTVARHRDPLREKTIKAKSKKRKGKDIAHLGDLELLLTRILLQLHLHPTSFFSNSGELLRRV
jgi:hypothetical protein